MHISPDQCIQIYLLIEYIPVHGCTMIIPVSHTDEHSQAVSIFFFFWTNNTDYIYIYIMYSFTVLSLFLLDRFLKEGFLLLNTIGHQGNTNLKE